MTTLDRRLYSLELALLPPANESTLSGASYWPGLRARLLSEFVSDRVSVIGMSPLDDYRDMTPTEVMALRGFMDGLIERLVERARQPYSHRGDMTPECAQREARIAQLLAKADDLKSR